MLLLSALLGELAAPIHVLPVPVTVVELLLVGGGLYALMWAGGGPLVPPEPGRGFRIAALVVLAPVPFEVMGQRYALLGLLVILQVVLAGAILALACLIRLWWRPRDAGIALLMLVVGVVGGGFAAEASTDVRLWLVGDRLRSEAEASWRDPHVVDRTYGTAPVGEVLIDEGGGSPAAGWIWMRTIGPDAEPHALIYAPGRSLVDGDLEPVIDLPGEGSPFSCDAATLVDDFYWCFVE